ncbi:MAG: hypothetical protein A3E25_23090 [Burkholderiales bacterium RIFCSPHIGHO2_12_FULL_69_20]|nr:MAG: hypothetical protein A3E25_23090 [Burkholderiales bacterium RIFCSPHIGHO2_12_FULL_69_20]
MIHVQIASQVTANGVDGIRWVLIEPVAADHGPAPAPAALLAASSTPWPVASTPDAPALPSSARLTLLKGLVILLGLGAALGMARQQFGAPTVRWWAPAPTLLSPPQPRSVPPAQRVQPAQPAPAPASHGSAGALVVKASN